MTRATHPINAARSTRPSQSTDPSGQAGLTLVELMVALVLGLVLILGVLNIFVSNRETFRVTENLTRIQENARAGFDFMARDVREAGQNPCGTNLGRQRHTQNRCDSLVGRLEQWPDHWR